MSVNHPHPALVADLLMLSISIDSYQKTLNPPPAFPEGEEVPDNIPATYAESRQRSNLNILINTDTLNSLSNVYWFLKKAIALTPDQTRVLSVLDHIYTSLAAEGKASDKSIMATTLSIAHDSGLLQAGATKYTWLAAWNEYMENLLTVTFPEIRRLDPNDPSGNAYSSDTFTITFGTNVAVLGA